MTLTEIDKIMGAQSRAFSSENELVLHFALSLASLYTVSADRFYFERHFSLDFKTRSGHVIPFTESYLDMVVVFDQRRIGFEFKYSTRKLQFTDQYGMPHSLKDHSANDIVRHSFRKDIYRLEKLIQKKELDHGFAILLTNDLNIIHRAQDVGNLDDNYRFTDHIPLKDSGWNNTKYSDSHWTKKGDKDYITDLNKDYPIEWKSNSCKESNFRYCIVEV